MDLVSCTPMPRDGCLAPFKINIRRVENDKKTLVLFDRPWANPCPFPYSDRSRNRRGMAAKNDNDCLRVRPGIFDASLTSA